MTKKLAHETSRIGIVGSDLAINLDEPLGDYEGYFAASQGVLELVT